MSRHHRGQRHDVGRIKALRALAPRPDKLPNGETLAQSLVARGLASSLILDRPRWEKK